MLSAATGCDLTTLSRSVSVDKLQLRRITLLLQSTAVDSRARNSRHPTDHNVLSLLPESNTLVNECAPVVSILIMYKTVHRPVGK